MPAKTRKPREQAAYQITHDGQKYHALYLISDELVVPTRKRDLKNRMGFSSVVSRKMSGGHTVLYVPLAEYKEAQRQRAAAGVEEGHHSTSQWDWQHLRIKRRRTTSLGSTPKKGATCEVASDVTAASHGLAAGKSKAGRVMATKGRREARKRAAAGCRRPGYVPVPKARKQAVRRENKARMQLINDATRKLYDKPGNKKSWAACTKAASAQLKKAGQL